MSLTADLAVLTILAEQKLPAAAARYLAANNAVAAAYQADGLEAQAFYREWGSYVPVGAAFGEWVRGRDLYQVVLGDTGDTLLACAEALKLCRDAYIESDEDMRDEVEKTAEELGFEKYEGATPDSVYPAGR